jgi:hypothetical protein
VNDAGPTAHAVFSPSAAHRWFECPGSIRLSAEIPRESSTAADEGTAAHTVAARCLTNGNDAMDYLGEDIIVEKNSFPVTEHMVEAVQLYVDTVRDLVRDGYTLKVEARLDLGHLAPGQFGTGDAVLYRAKTRHLVVVDLKYGRMVFVEVEENPQLLSYGSGAAALYKGKVDRLTLTIVQPRGPGTPVRSWDIPNAPAVISQFEEDFVQAVKEASEPDAPLSAGEWCTFCPAKGICPEYRNLALRLAQAEFSSAEPATVTLPDPAALSSSELGGILSAANLIEDWVEAVKKVALARALAGDVPVGHKLVRKNTLRRWVDEQKAAKALATLYELDVDTLWVSKLISPAQAEKLVGKAGKAGLASLVTKPEGDVTIAPLADKRPPIAVDVRQEFDNLISKVHD